MKGWLTGGIIGAIILLIPSFLYFNPLGGDTLGIIYIISAVIVGAIIGWIVGKIKSRNN